MANTTVKCKRLSFLLSPIYTGQDRNGRGQDTGQDMYEAAVAAPGIKLSVFGGSTKDPE